jgi:hypothetical protein
MDHGIIDNERRILTLTPVQNVRLILLAPWYSFWSGPI